MTITQLIKRFDFWRARLMSLGLGHMDMYVKWAANPHEHSDAAMSVVYEDDYDAFYVEALRSWVNSHTREEVDEVIIHELLHVVFRDYDNLCDRGGQKMGREARALWVDMKEHELERLIRRLATTIREVSD